MAWWCFPPAGPRQERLKCEADSENNREPDQTHGHLGEDGWRESSRRELRARRAWSSVSTPAKSRCVYATCRATPPVYGSSCRSIGAELGSSRTATQCSSPAASPARAGRQLPRAFSGSAEPVRGACLGLAPATADRSAARAPRRSNGDSWAVTRSRNSRRSWRLGRLARCRSARARTGR